MESYECSDDRDKVFAALGAAADISLDDITPGYQKQVEVIYTEALRFVNMEASGRNCYDLPAILFDRKGGTQTPGCGFTTKTCLHGYVRVWMGCCT